MWPYIGRNATREGAVQTDPRPAKRRVVVVAARESEIKLKTDVFFPRKEEEMRRLFHRDAPDTERGRRRDAVLSRQPFASTRDFIPPDHPETRVSNPYVRMAQSFLGRDFVRIRLCIFLHLTRPPAYLSS